MPAVEQLEHKDTVIFNRVAALSWSNWWGHLTAGCIHPGYHFREQTLRLTAGHMLPSSPRRSSQEDLSLPNSYTLNPPLISGQKHLTQEKRKLQHMATVLEPFTSALENKKHTWCFDLKSRFAEEPLHVLPLVTSRWRMGSISPTQREQRDASMAR